MRMLITAVFPHEPFNTLVRQGKAGKILERILEDFKAEAAYFIEDDGKRCGVFVVDMPAVHDIPRFAEPLFLNFQADCRFRPAMLPADLQRAGLEQLGKKWSK